MNKDQITMIIFSVGAVIVTFIALWLRNRRLYRDFISSFSFDANMAISCLNSFQVLRCAPGNYLLEVSENFFLYSGTLGFNMLFFAVTATVLCFIYDNSVVWSIVCMLPYGWFLLGGILLQRRRARLFDELIETYRCYRSEYELIYKAAKSMHSFQIVGAVALLTLVYTFYNF